MKTMITIAAAAALLAVAGTAAAQTPLNVPIEGLAEASCSLPSTWTVNSTNGATAGQFGGTTWNIPPSALASASGQAATGVEYAIRVRGDAFCNTSHTINIRSVRGGLAAGAVGDAAPGAAPAGFANRRSMNYQALWVASGVSSGTVPLGQSVSLVASTPGAQNTSSYIVGGSLPPPGNRSFDVRMGLPRTALATPLIAGAYSDNLIVTISTAP